MDVGFVGLGIMGRPMAGHLARAGHRLFLHSRSGVPAELVEAGGTPCGGPAEVARRSEAVITMLPDTPDVEQVILGPGGVLEGITAGKMVVDMSSISPIATRAIAGAVAAAGCDWLDAPVSGGEVGARNAALTVMAGGTEAAFARARPLLESMGKSITHVGAAGHGQVCKVANQIVVALHIEAVAEALVFAAKAGADPARVRQALLGGFAASRVLEVHGKRMLDRTFDPGFRIDLHRKDLGLALSGARALGLALPATALAQELMNAAAGAGDGPRDHSALVKVLERLASHELGSGAGGG